MEAQPDRSSAEKLPMNLWFRLIWLLLTRPFQPKLKPPFEASILPFRVWLHDLDTSLHMNNAR